MKRVRPTSVTVMGILNIVFGSLSLLCMVCMGISLLVLSSPDMLRLPNGVNPVADMWDFMKREIPGYVAITIGSLVLGLIMSILLLTAGIGLLNMQNWARVMSILYSIVTVLTQLGSLIFTLAFVNPATARWQADFIRRQVGMLPPGADLGGNSALNNIGAVAGAAIGIIYAVVLLIMMLTPTVSAAFGGRPPASDYEAGQHGDEGDDYDRRPRRDGWND
jgi:hypothetical protein